MISKEMIRQYKDTERIIVQGDDFMYLYPSESVSDIVSNYTITFPSLEMISDEYTVIPHGCATLVVSFDNTGIHSDIFGSMTKPVSVGTKANKSSLIFIIEFQPAGLFLFTGINQKTLVNKIVSVETINSALNVELSEILGSTSSVEELIKMIEIVIEKYRYTKGLVEQEESMRSIVLKMGNVSIKELADNVGYSERQLNRIFDKYLGMSIKQFSRLVRVNKAIRIMQEGSNSLTEVCYASGFYDMSHFIRDFKNVCGVTPRQYLKSMSDFYNELSKYK